MKGKKVKESSIIMAHMMLPEDANPSGNVHGGVIMKHIDNAAGVAAIRHCRCNVVTASIDRMSFHSPVYIGNLLSLKASVNHVGRSSMEIGVRAEAENLVTGEIRHVVTSYLTFVALDKNGRPTPVPPLILETKDEKRRNCQAEERRAARLREKQSEKCDDNRINA